MSPEYQARSQPLKHASIRTQKSARRTTGYESTSNVANKVHNFQQYVSHRVRQNSRRNPRPRPARGSPFLAELIAKRRGTTTAYIRTMRSCAVQDFASTQVEQVDLSPECAILVRSAILCMQLQVMPANLRTRYYRLCRSRDLFKETKDASDGENR